jgi:hypothetical protein
MKKDLEDIKLEMLYGKKREADHSSRLDALMVFLQDL